MRRPTVPALTASNTGWNTTAVNYVGRHCSGVLSVVGYDYQPRHARQWTP